MAAALYPSFKQLLLGAGINLTSDDIRVILIDTGVYTFSSLHDFRDDITGVVGTASPALTSKTITSGVFDAANTVISSVTGATVEAIILYRNVGTAATDPLICFIDGLTLTPDGNNVNVNFNASGIFAL